MKSPESFNFSPEEDPLDPESRRYENTEERAGEGIIETPEFNEERIDRDRLRSAIDSALDGDPATGLPTTIEELQARAERLADKFEEEERDASVSPEELRRAFESADDSEADGNLGSSSQEMTEEELRGRMNEEEGSEDWRDAA